MVGAYASKGIGLVEVFDGTTWETVCHGTWNLAAANVTCRQLGYSGAHRVLNVGDPGVPNGRSTKAALGYLQCRGDEQNIFHCPHRSFYTRDQYRSCSPGHGVGVQCKNFGSKCIYEYNIILTGQDCFIDSFTLKNIEK